MSFKKGFGYMKKNVVVGMSGGVDSSVAAYLLKEQGYDVIGVTMQIWQQEDACTVEHEGGCCGMSAVEDARRVAAQLDIPYYVMNFRDDFQKYVIDYFVDEYKKGHTPNPCIACNKYVKWQSLLQRSMEIGADYIATGHNARIVKLDNGRYTIKMSATKKKDQTYVLFNLSQEQHRRTLMPVGEYNKDQIREIAEKIGYSYTYVRTYAMDLQSIKKINKNAEDSVSGPGYENKEDEYDGTWSGVFTGGKPWTQEDEAYLVIMKNPLIKGRILEINGNLDIAWMVYHPVKGLLYMKIPPRYRICSEQKKNLIDRTQAADYLDKEINATNIDGKSIQITDISLVYAVDELSSEGIQCSPYWRFGFQKRKNSESVWLYKDLNEYDTYSDTEDVKHQENGYFLINAVDGSIMY